jgi:glyoxylase-like metal-dependent hydrolase (beta-lactamase superfamily II)
VNVEDKYPVTLASNEGWDERILVIHCGEMVDNFIIITTRYVILVDTMISPQTATMMLDMAGEHLTEGRQLLVINTHADFDHCWGNQVFVGASAIYPAPIIATRRAAERFHSPEAENMVLEMREKDPDVYADVELTPPTILFDDQLIIDGGDLTLRLFATPGHQPDHISILIPEIALLLAGDAAESPFPFAQSPASLPQLRASLAHMAALNPVSVLYCHAPLNSGPDLLRQNIAYFDTLEQRCREAMDLGVPPNPGEDADVVALINFPLTEAVPPLAGESYPEFYLNGHAAQIRIMLEFLGLQRQEESTK